MKVWNKIAAGGALLLGATAANATLMALNFSGTLTSGGTGSYSGQIQYDTSAIASCGSNPDEAYCNYFNMTMYSTITVGGKTYSFGGPARGQTQIFDATDSNTQDEYAFTSSSVDSNNRLNLFLIGAYTAFSGAALPTLNAQLAQLNQTEMEFDTDLNKSQNYKGYEGSVTAMSVSIVPEPSQWMLMITGFGLIGTALSRQQRRTSAAINPFIGGAAQ